MNARLSSAGNLLAAAAPAGDIRDIRGLIPIPAGPPWGLYAGVAVALALVIAVVVYVHRRRANPPNPYVLAQARLRTAHADRGSARSATFAERVSAAVREYIEARCGVRAAHRTTDEFLLDLVQGQSVHAELARHRAELARFLNSCDLAKFAGRELPVPLREELCRDARRFIDAVEGRSSEVRP